MNPQRAKPPPKGAVQSIPVESGEHVEEFKVKWSRTKKIYTYPSPPCKLPPLQSPPPHPGDRHFHVFLVNMYCAGLCCPSALRMALHCFSHYFKSSTCVCSVIFSLQRRCMGVLCCYFKPKMFTPVDHESAQLSRLEALAVESPKSPESPDVAPMAPQPQTPAHPTHVPRSSLPFLWILNNICVG